MPDAIIGENVMIEKAIVPSHLTFRTIPVIKCDRASRRNCIGYRRNVQHKH